MRTLVALFVVGMMLSAGCTAPRKAAGTGALVGAAAGAAVGSYSANAGKGALLGAGVGALSGYLIGASNAAYYKHEGAYPGGRRCGTGFYLNRRGRCVRY